MTTILLTAFAVSLAALPVRFIVRFLLSLRRLHREDLALKRAQASLAAILAETSGCPIWADLASQPRYLTLTWRWVPGPDPLADERLAKVVAKWGES